MSNLNDLCLLKTVGPKWTERRPVVTSKHPEEGDVEGRQTNITLAIFNVPTLNSHQNRRDLFDDYSTTVTQAESSASVNFTFCQSITSFRRTWELPGIAY